MVLLFAGQAAAVLLAVADDPLAVFVPVAVTNLEVPVKAEDEDELTALLPRRTREPETWLLSDELGLPSCDLSQQVPAPTPFLPPT
jgi:hypothetical protein